MNKSRGHKKTVGVRHKQRLGLGWLLLIPVAALPIAVYLAWKAPAPVSTPPPEARIEQSHSGPPLPEPPEPAPVANQETAKVPETSSVPFAEGPTITPPEPPGQHSTKASVPGTSVTKKEIPERTDPPKAPLIDWADIANRPGRWPAQTRMTAPADFPISVEGKASGSTRVPAGTSVKVVKIAPDGVQVAYAEYSAKVALDQTTLSEQLLAAASETQPATTAVEAPPKPVQTPQAAATPRNDGASLVPQQNWLKPPGDERMSLIELLKVLEHDSQPDPALEVSEHPEIFKGVTLMMPLREALAKLGVAKDLIPSRIPLVHPAIPLFYRSFPHKYSLIGDPEDHYNLLYVITDGDDRVVGIQYVCENPRSKMQLPKESFLTYNFVTNRRKAASALKVGCEVTAFSNDVLLIESWLFDERRDKCLEIVRLYLPKRVANFVRHVIEARLELDE